MGRVSVIQYAKADGLAIPPSSSLFTVLWLVMKAKLLLSDQETLKIIHHKRLMSPAEAGDVSDTLMQMDDCTDFMERTDVELVKRAQTCITADEHEHDNFK